MFCANCGKEIEAGAKVCPHCGAEQGASKQNASPEIGKTVKAAADKAAAAADKAAAAAKAFGENENVRKAMAKTESFFTCVEDGRFLRWCIAVILYGVCTLCALKFINLWWQKLMGTDCGTGWNNFVFTIAWAVVVVCFIAVFWYLFRQTRRILVACTKNVRGGFGVTLLPIIARFIQATSEAFLVFTILLGVASLILSFLSPTTVAALSPFLFFVTELPLDPEFFTLSGSIDYAFVWPLIGIIYFLIVRLCVEFSVIFLEILSNLEAIRAKLVDKDE